MSRPTWTMKDPNNAADIAGPITAEQLRQADCALLAGPSAFEVFPGVAGLGQFEISVDGDDNWSAADGAAVLPGVAGGGPYRSGFPGTMPAPLPARDSTNPRKDLAVARVYDQLGRKESVIEVLEGAAGPGTIFPPALPSRAVHLGVLDVPAVGGGPVTVDTSGRTYACALGGELLASSAATLPASAQLHQRAKSIGSGIEYIWDGAQWEAQDTDWIPLGLPVTTGYSLPGGTINHPHVSREGHWVTVRGFITRSVGNLGAGGTWQAMWNLDPDFRPPTIAGGSCFLGFYKGATAQTGPVVIWTSDFNGDFEIANVGTEPLLQGEHIGFNASWRID